MPVSEYFKGSGNKVMENMAKQYGAKKGKQVFYATANKKGQTAKKGAGPTKKKSDDMIKKFASKK